jgi:RNA polymerase sigma-70 factor (ECF subfamily)
MTDPLTVPVRTGEVPPDADREDGLVSRLRAGDARAFDAFVRRYTPRLLAVAGRFLRSEEDRADAVQDTFLYAFRALGSFEGKSRLSTWLHRILVNACLAKLRSQSRGTEVPLDDLLPVADSSGGRGPALLAGSDLTSAETRAQVRACIDRLPESYRTVLRLRDLEELDTDQTARTIGTSRAVVKTRLHRARRALRSLLKPLLAV